MHYQNQGRKQAKPGDDKLIYKFNDILIVGCLEWNFFYPFGKVFSSCKDVFMLFRRMRNDPTYYIQSPLFKWLLNVDWM